MTEPNELLWSHAVETEDWPEAARLERLAAGMIIESLVDGADDTVNAVQMQTRTGDVGQ